MPIFLNSLAKYSLALPRAVKRILALWVDTISCALAVWIAYYLRLGELNFEWSVLIIPTLISIGLAIPIFVTAGLYRAIFRYSGLPAMVTMAWAMLIYGVSYTVVFTIYGVKDVPRTIGLLQPMLLALIAGSTRVTVRVWLGGLYQRQLSKLSGTRVLIYGAGSAGRQLALAIAQSQDLMAVGFVDDDDKLQGQILNGLEIFSPHRLSEIISKKSVTDVYLALPSVTRQRRNEILNLVNTNKVSVRTLPGLSELVSGKVSLSDIRDLDIDDLLGREPVKPHGLLINLNTNNKKVLVTGAGGSIGSELCRQILLTNPKLLLLVDISEFALYQIHQELLAKNLDAEIVPLLASVCDDMRMHEIMDTWTPDTVYHAAAYKHVPMVEHNPAEGVRNNIWGTRVCAEAAVRNGVKNFVLISTDKAVRPTNIMGATKRLAEMVLQAMAQLNPAVTSQGGRTPNVRTYFSMVRFGNVLGSSGSVVPLFRKQIRDGGPITVTHPEISRYFMTIPEAAQLVIQAGAMGQGGDVFVLDMGHPVKIMDLARRMANLSGMSIKDELNPDGDLEIQITGLRPGEKLYEELLIGDNPKPTQHPRIMRAQEQFVSWSILEPKLNALSMAVGVNDVPVIRGLLEQLVEGYEPSGEVVDWVHLAQAKEAQ